MEKVYHPILSEGPEDQLKAIRWAKEELERIKHDKGEQLADEITEK